LAGTHIKIETVKILLELGRPVRPWQHIVIEEGDPLSACRAPAHVACRSRATASGAQYPYRDANIRQSQGFPAAHWAVIDHDEGP
jgi:hypothetical protein